MSLSSNKVIISVRVIQVYNHSGYFYQQCTVHKYYVFKLSPWEIVFAEYVLALVLLVWLKV